MVVNYLLQSYLVMYLNEYTMMMPATAVKKVDQPIRRLGIGDRKRNLILEAPRFSCPSASLQQANS